MTIQEKQNQLIKEFSKHKDWTDRYKRIIELGKSLDRLPKNFMTEENRVRGCQSITFLYAKLDGNKITYQAESDALIVRGLAQMLISVFSGHTPQEILAAKADFLKEIGLTTHLSQSRSNGLAAMVRQFKNYAIAFNVVATSLAK